MCRTEKFYVNRLEFILYSAELITPSRLTWKKSTLLDFGILESECKNFAKMLAGYPLHGRQLKRGDWNFLIEKVNKKLGKETLLNAISFVWMSAMRTPSKVIKIIDKEEEKLPIER